jgi:hypothetical protein
MATLHFKATTTATPVGTVGKGRLKKAFDDAVTAIEPRRDDAGETEPA